MRVGQDLNKAGVRVLVQHVLSGDELLRCDVAVGSPAIPQSRPLRLATVRLSRGLAKFTGPRKTRVRPLSRTLTPLSYERRDREGQWRTGERSHVYRRPTGAFQGANVEVFVEDRAVSGTARTRTQVFIVRIWYEAQEESKKEVRIQARHVLTGEAARLPVMAGADGLPGRQAGRYRPRSGPVDRSDGDQLLTRCPGPPVLPPPTAPGGNLL